MSYSNIQPEVIDFDTKDSINKSKLLPHIKKCFLTTILLTEADYHHGSITIGSVTYLLYVTVQLENLLINNVALYKHDARLLVLASFQQHTNGSNIVLCKVMPRNKYVISKQEEYKVSNTAFNNRINN